MIVEWEIPFTLETTLLSPADLQINAGDPATGYVYLLDPESCANELPLRVTTDPIPQGNGEILHERFTDGMSITLSVQLWTYPPGTTFVFGQDNNAKPACGEDAWKMADALYSYAFAMLNDDNARVLWTPTGYGGRRMITEARLRAMPAPKLSNGVVVCDLTFDTPFPYAISLAQTTPSLSGTITNNGNTDFYPVLKVDGPTSAFLVSNGTIGRGIVYNGTAIGGGHYAEIDCFRGTITLDGDVQTILAGIDPLLSELALYNVPGANTWVISGASGTMLANDSFV